MLEFWQNLPLYINPIIFSIGNLSFRWYSLGYVLALITIYILLKYQLKNNRNIFIPKNLSLSKLENILLAGFLGALLGGRIGYIVFYDWTNLIYHPWQIFWPFSDGSFVGFYGMSFHGGLLGALLAGWLICKKYSLDFWKIVNFIIPAFPLGYFWGRIGNFMNGELYGRFTDSNLGMHFKSDNATEIAILLGSVPQNPLRHPSQLYEAFGEGILLFFILAYFTRKKFWNQNLLWLFLIFYGIIRFAIEFFRQPDPQLGFMFLGWMTMGQILSLGMFSIGLIILWVKKIH